MNARRAAQRASNGPARKARAGRSDGERQWH